MKKTNNLLGKLRSHTTTWFGCAAALCLAAVNLSAEDAPVKKDAAAAEETTVKKEAAAEADAVEYEEINNWIDFTIGGVISDTGNKAAFQRRAGMTGDLFGGISDMRYEREIGDLTLLIEGHALFGMEDYDLRLRVDKTDLGYVSAGFRHFRTWYDGSGGFVPGVAGAWVPLYDDELYVDRGSLWFEAGLRQEDLPQITFNYTHDWRNGQKDSTIWAATRPLVPFPLVAGSFGYGTVPTLSHLNERRDTFRLDISHTLGNTDFDLGLTYETVRNDNERESHRAPGDPTASNDRNISHRDIYDSDLFNANISSETRINDQMLLSLGYAFTTMNSNTTGSERYSYDRTGAWRSYADHGNSPLIGGAEHAAHVANANFWWNPIPDLVIVPSIRAEWEDQGAVAMFIEWDRVTRLPLDEHFSSESDIHNFAQQIDIRYTGVNNLLLYGRAEHSASDRTLQLRDIDDEVRNSTSDVDVQKYTAGATWYPIRGLSVAAQGYRRDYQQDYDHMFNPVAGNTFDAQFVAHDVLTYDANFRLTWRALPNLTLVSRYDYQETTIENQALNAAGGRLRKVESAYIERDVFSQSVTWQPFENAYFQGSISYVLAETNTPADNYIPRRLTDTGNDYVTASLGFGYAFDKKTDVQVNYSYYYANNYNIRYQPAAPPALPTAAPGSVFYGSSAEEHSLTVAVNRQICPNVIWNLGYGFFTGNDGLSGGNNNFTAHMVSTGVKIRF